MIQRQHSQRHVLRGPQTVSSALQGLGPPSEYNKQSAGADLGHQSPLSPFRRTCPGCQRDRTAGERHAELPRGPLSRNRAADPHNTAQQWPNQCWARLGRTVGRLQFGETCRDTLQCTSPMLLIGTPRPRSMKTSVMSIKRPPILETGLKDKGAHGVAGDRACTTNTDSFLGFVGGRSKYNI